MIILSELNQIEKDKYHIISLIGSTDMANKLTVCKGDSRVRWYKLRVWD